MCGAHYVCYYVHVQNGWKVQMLVHIANKVVYKSQNDDNLSSEIETKLSILNEHISICIRFVMHDHKGNVFNRSQMTYCC